MRGTHVVLGECETSRGTCQAQLRQCRLRPQGFDTPAELLILANGVYKQHGGLDTHSSYNTTGSGPRTVTSRSRLAASMEGASSFLLQHRDPDGLWREFDLIRGTSDEWVSAYIGLALAGDVQVAQSVVEILCNRRTGSEGWGYSATTPPDADSTAWVSRLALIAGRPDACERGLRFLKRCLHSSGGVATYDSPVAIRRFLGDPPISLRGWCSPHVCVTAAVSWLAEISRYPLVRQFLRDAQQPAGNWQAYWWPDPSYATWLAVEAMRHWGDAEDRSRVARAAQWAADAVEDEGPWALACRIAILSDLDATAAGSLASRLIDQQQPDGSWASSAALRIPPPQVIDPSVVSEWIPAGKGFSSVNLDHRRLYTTATALRALQSLL